MKQLRGYCLQLTCGDSVAGRTEESSPEEMPLAIHRLVHLLPPDYQAWLARNSEITQAEPVRRC
jgi:hypothetical protein